jgi:hypothetical protein
MTEKQLRLTKNACADHETLDWTGKYMVYWMCEHIKHNKKEIYNALIEWESFHYTCEKYAECKAKSKFITDPKDIF